MAQYITPQTPIYPYYAPNRNYYGGRYGTMTSGLTMLPGNDVSAGWTNMMNALTNIQKQNAAEQQRKIDEFNKLNDVVLDGVRQQWLPEAQKKADELRKMSIDAYRSGMTADKQLQLLQKKKELERYAGMAQETQNMFKDATKKILTIKDPELQRQSAENLKKIYETGDLSQQYNALTNGDWISTKDYTINDLISRWNKNKTIPYSPDLKNKGSFKFDDNKAQKIIIADLNSGVPDIVDMYDKAKQNNPDLTPEEFAKNTSKSLTPYFNDKAAKTFVNTKQKTTGPKKPVIPMFERSANGDISLGQANKGKGIPLGPTEVDGKVRKNPTIIKETTIKDPKTGKQKKVWKVAYTIESEERKRLLDGAISDVFNDIKEEKHISDKEWQKMTDEQKQKLWKDNDGNIRLQKDKAYGLIQFNGSMQDPNIVGVGYVDYDPAVANSLYRVKGDNGTATVKKTVTPKTLLDWINKNVKKNAK